MSPPRSVVAGLVVGASLSVVAVAVLAPRIVQGLANRSLPRQLRRMGSRHQVSGAAGDASQLDDSANGSFGGTLGNEEFGEGIDDETILMLEENMPFYEGATTDTNVPSLTEVPVLNLTILSSTLRSDWIMAAPMMNYQINEAFDPCPRNRTFPYCAVQFRCTTDVTSPLLNIIGEDMLHCTLNAKAYIAQRTSVDSLDSTNRKVKVPQLEALVTSLAQCRTGDGRDPDIAYIATTNTSEECGVDITTCVLSLVIIRGRVAFVVQLQCRRDPTYFQRHLQTFISVAGQVAQQALSLQPRHVTLWTRVRRKLLGGSLIAPPLSRCDRCLIAREDTLCLQFNLPSVGTSGDESGVHSGVIITVPTGSNRYMPWAVNDQGVLTAESVSTLETIKERSPEVHKILCGLLVDSTCVGGALKQNVGIDVSFILDDFTGRGVTVAMHLVGPEEQELFHRYAALEQELTVLNPTTETGDAASQSPVVGPAATGRVRSLSVVDTFTTSKWSRGCKYVLGLIRASSAKRQNVTAVLEGSRATDLFQELSSLQIPPAQRPHFRSYFKRGQRNAELEMGAVCCVALNATVENVIVLVVSPPDTSRGANPATPTTNKKEPDNVDFASVSASQTRFSHNEIRRYMSVVRICSTNEVTLMGSLHFLHRPSGVSYKLPFKLSRQPNTIFFTHLFGNFYFEWCRDYRLLALVTPADDVGNASLNSSPCHMAYSNSSGNLSHGSFGGQSSIHHGGNCCTFRIGVSDSRQPLQQLIERVYPHAAVIAASNRTNNDFTFSVEGQHGEHEYVSFSQKNGLTVYFAWTYFQHVISKGFTAPTVHNPVVARKALSFDS